MYAEEQTWIKRDKNFANSKINVSLYILYTYKRKKFHGYLIFPGIHFRGRSGKKIDFASIYFHERDVFFYFFFIFVYFTTHLGYDFASIKAKYDL